MVSKGQETLLTAMDVIGKVRKLPPTHMQIPKKRGRSKVPVGCSFTATKQLQEKKIPKRKSP